MVGQQHSSDYKLTAIKHYEKSENFTETCRVFHCNRHTLRLWYNKYKIDNNLTRKERQEGSYKVKKELVQYATNRISCAFFPISFSTYKVIIYTCSFGYTIFSYLK